MARAFLTEGVGTIIVIISYSFLLGSRNQQAGSIILFKAYSLVLFVCFTSWRVVKLVFLDDPVRR